MSSTFLRFSIVLLLWIGPSCCRQVDEEKTYRIDSLDCSEFTVRTIDYCQKTLRYDTTTLAELDTNQLLGFTIKVNTTLINVKELGLLPILESSLLYACKPSRDYTKYENPIDSIAIVTLKSYGNYLADDTISALAISRKFSCDSLVKFRNEYLEWYYNFDSIDLIISERAPSNTLLKYKLIFYAKGQNFEYITKDWKTK